jgi:hypothetical protein
MIGCMSSPSGIMHFDPWYFFSRSTFDSINLETYFLLSVLSPLIGAEIIDLNHCFT